MDAADVCPSVRIPLGGGYFRPAKWARLLEDGRVAAFHEDNTLNDSPYICDIFAKPDYVDYEDPDRPLEALEPWFTRTLSGSATHYAVLREELEKEQDWGLVTEAERYRRIDGEIRATRDRIEILHSEVERKVEERKQCEGRMVAARTQAKVGKLAARFSPYSPGLLRFAERKGKQASRRGSMD